jgi:hypothetical protein
MPLASWSQSIRTRGRSLTSLHGSPGPVPSYPSGRHPTVQRGDLGRPNRRVVRVTAGPNSTFDVIRSSPLRAHAKVPFCAEVREPAPVVLAPRSVPPRRRSTPIRGALTSVTTLSPCGLRRTLGGPEKSLRRPCWSRKLHAPETLRGHSVGRLLRLHASNVDPGRRTGHNGCARQAVGDTSHVKAVVTRRYHKVKPFTWCDPLGCHDVAT